jgi:hypothetical protein
MAPKHQLAKVVICLGLAFLGVTAAHAEYRYRHPASGLTEALKAPSAPPQLKDFGSYRGWEDGTYAASCLSYLNGDSTHSYGGATGSGVYRINLNGAPTSVYCDMEFEGGGWTLVRRTKAGTAWFPLSDNLAGSSYGTYVADPVANATFSLAYSGLSFSEFSFKTGDAAKWLIVNKGQVSIVGDCSTRAHTIKKSHVSSTPYAVAWCNRTVRAEDPWISVYDHQLTAESDTHSMLYGEYGWANWTRWLSTRNGANVWVR